MPAGRGGHPEKMKEAQSAAIDSRPELCGHEMGTKRVGVQSILGGVDASPTPSVTRASAAFFAQRAQGLGAPTQEARRHRTLQYIAQP